MLTHLLITNYALIDNLEIEFKKGLTIITGETGAGKSIILGALSLILGERADLKVIRKVESKSVIEATFNIEAYDRLESFFEQNDIEYYGNECILRREIYSNGRSRAFINDSPVTLSVLRDLTLRLIDIHSQHSNMLLREEDYQLNIIDSVSNNEVIRAEYAELFSKYKCLKAEILALKAEYEKNRAEEDYIQFQLLQISELKLQENEDIELEREQMRLSNVNEIKQCLWSASSMIQDEENSIISKMSTIMRGFSQIEGVDANLKELSERLQSMIIELKDFGRTINLIQDSYVDNPLELERVTERLNSIYDLENKHKLSSVNEIIALQHYYKEKIAKLTNSEEEINRLEIELAKVEHDALNKAQELSQSRKKGAEIFKETLKETATPLGMKNLRFELEFSECELFAQGIDKVKFLFAFNKQQQLMPIESTASGGELSRVMLSIKAIIAQNMQLPTIIFDEVDTGVSGEIAHKMGEMMCGISKNIQVIAITHLPQVAVIGDNHLRVYKADSDEATYTSICELSKDERVEEIARMLSGKEIDAAAINNARSLLGF